ncbi:hemerythrin domain-containing protein [Micromonospora narathiwatensis]|uniref:Hemerythrin HHE cation binding domain-containing protein n=1 Tax=Micromonospora narathiwatensis TaxID=299146 RepID=A0A1A8ZXX3_9ACTN|nr:hemerythrin domain-containing protein [Micromonospora narathiwatensis]SBT48743.1 Hemerythrin HHE cation binding domain-containing protein [Micromonospora narathiwatensis]
MAAVGMEARDGRGHVHPSQSPAGRLTALGTQLIEIHHWLREELARLRASLDSPDGAGPGLSRELRAHCLGFCAALDRHHTSEDGGAFRVLAEQVPELRPVLATLSEDHRAVAAILTRVEELVTGQAAGPTVRAELDGLAALLESHFSYEERKLVAALDAVSGGTAEELLGLDVPDGDPTVEERT